MNRKPLSTNSSPQKEDPKYKKLILYSSPDSPHSGKRLPGSKIDIHRSSDLSIQTMAVPTKKSPFYSLSKAKNSLQDRLKVFVTQYTSKKQSQVVPVVLTLGTRFPDRRTDVAIENKIW